MSAKRKSSTSSSSSSPSSSSALSSNSGGSTHSNEEVVQPPSAKRPKKDNPKIVVSVEIRQDETFKLVATVDAMELDDNISAFRQRIANVANEEEDYHPSKKVTASKVQLFRKEDVSIAHKEIKGETLTQRSYQGVDEFVALVPISVIPLAQTEEQTVINRIALGEQTPFLRVNNEETWVDVKQLSIAGFSGDEIRAYVREEAVEMWNAIEDSLQNGYSLEVSGPPGTGKSTEAWAWAKWKAVDAKTTVMWFHMSARGLKAVVVDGDEKTLTGRAVDQHSMYQTIRNAPGSIFVFDGITKDLSKSISSSLNVWRSRDEDRQYVTVSSQAVVVATEQDEEVNLLSHTVPSWLLEQYHSAVQNDVFFNQVKDKLVCPESPDNSHENITEEQESELRETLVAAKFYYSGGCARWMFGFDYKKFIGDFDKHWGKVEDYDNFVKELSGIQASVSVNYLRCVLKTPHGMKSFFISKYLMRQFLSTMDSGQRQFLLLAYAKADEMGNPSFKGWVYEFDMDNQLKQASRAVDAKDKKITFSVNGDLQEFPVTDYVTYDDVVELSDPLEGFRSTSEGSMWASPSLWCEGAFDFLRFEFTDENLHVDALNTTIGKSHSLKLNKVHMLGVKLAGMGFPVSSFCFVFVCPNLEFNIRNGQVMGDLSNWGWPKNNVGELHDRGLLQTWTLCAQET